MVEILVIVKALNGSSEIKFLPLMIGVHELSTRLEAILKDKKNLKNFDH